LFCLFELTEKYSIGDFFSEKISYYCEFTLNLIQIKELNNKLYFFADNFADGRELWVTDGTRDGTKLLKDINPDRSSSLDFYGLTKFNNKLYFSADDGSNGRELWISDGTESGTQLLKDLNPGSYDFNGYSYPESSSPKEFFKFNNKLYFIADDGVNGTELWVTDGTTNGTQLLKDINPQVFSNPRFFTEFNNKLYFVANDGVNGTELWVTDGTTNGTQLVADIRPGRIGSSIRDFIILGDELFFSADNGSAVGFELFKLTLDGSTTITGTNRADNLNGTTNSDQIEGLGGNDTLFGNAGNDTLLGGNGNDNLVGGVGNDSLFGAAGGDRITGGNGSDILDGGAGFDVLTGGANNDIFVLKNGNGSDSLTDFQKGSDKIGLAGGLEFEDLTLSGNTIRSGSELLATLIGVNTTNLTETNFTTV
jgi:ELWxxDGT repeat protein